MKNKSRMESLKKYHLLDIGGEVIKDNETYVLRDNKDLKNLVVSSTELKPGQSTRGHSHVGQEEVYIFISGQATIEVDNKVDYANPGEIFLIPDGAFHRVHNDSKNTPCYFVCIFDGNRNH